MRHRRPRPRWTIGLLLFWLFLAGLVLSFFAEERRNKLLASTYERNRKETLLFHAHVQHVRSMRAANVDQRDWGCRVNWIEEEPFVHPLRGIGAEETFVSRLAGQTASLAGINRYIESKMMTGPLQMEALAELRGRIEEDYDFEGRTRKGSEFYSEKDDRSHPDNCSELFDEYFRKRGIPTGRSMRSHTTPRPGA